MTSSAQLFLAVDGGASSTRALLADNQGQIWGAGRAGPSNHLGGAEGEARLRAALQGAVGAAWQQACARGFAASANAVMPALARVWLGMTGYAHEDWERTLIGDTLLEQLPSPAPLHISEDILTAFVGASSYQPGVIVYAGTGSVAFGMDEQGKRARAGGWGYIIDDEGGAYALGRAALQAIYRAQDGRAPATSLHEAVLSALACKDIMHLRQRLYRGDISRSQLASLSPVISNQAQQGDAVAQAIMQQAGIALADLGIATAGQLALDNSATFYVSGGVFSAGETVLAPFRHRLSKAGSQAQVERAHFSPVIGAYILALEQCAIPFAPLADRVLEQLKQADLALLRVP